jgi:signal transduction histidine kinase
MTLGRKLFLLIGGMLCLLLAGQWLLYRSLSRKVSEDVRAVAFRVGEEIVSGFEYQFPAPGGAGDGELLDRLPPPADGEGGHARVFVMTKERSAQPPATGDSPSDSTAGAGVQPKKQLVLRQELRWTGDAPEAAKEGGFEFETPAAPGEPRKFAIDIDESEDVLLLRGPESARSIPIPRRAVSSTLERFGSQLLVGNLVLLAVGLGAAAWLAHRMTRPLAALADTAERVGAGELGAAVPLAAAGGRGRRDEVGRAVASFNRMSAHLAELDRENRRLAELEQLSELGDVARGLAHSLRNPLNALGLAIERLGARAGAGDDASPAVSDLVDGSRRQIRRIDGALRSFLALASTGGAQAEPVDLAALAREVTLEALHDAGDGAGPRLEVDSSAATRPTVIGVPAELKAVLQALVVNACEATRTRATTAHRTEGALPVSPTEARSGDVSIRVKGGAGGREDGVTVEIEDDGPGVPEAVRDRLFTPHTTTKPHGSGMGLFLAHRLATARYGGALRLEPRPEGGTRAVLELGDRDGARVPPDVRSGG